MPAHCTALHCTALHSALPCTPPVHTPFTLYPLSLTADTADPHFRLYGPCFLLGSTCTCLCCNDSSLEDLNLTDGRPRSHYLRAAASFVPSSFLAALFPFICSVTVLHFLLSACVPVFAAQTGAMNLPRLPRYTRASGAQYDYHGYRPFTCFPHLPRPAPLPPGERSNEMMMQRSGDATPNGTTVLCLPHFPET